MNKHELEKSNKIMNVKNKLDKILSNKIQEILIANTKFTDLEKGNQAELDTLSEKLLLLTMVNKKLEEKCIFDIY